MKQNLNRILSIFAAAAMMFSAVPQMTAFAADAGGTCGENLTWTLDSEGTLTVSGSGKIDAFSGGDTAVWQDNKNEIKAIVMENGVTEIGNQAFEGCENLTSVSIPDTVTAIGRYAFSGCSGLPYIEIPDSVKTIGNDAFADCSSLYEVFLPGNLEAIEDFLFYRCNKLQGIDFPEHITKIGDYAFKECEYLETVDIPESVNSIGNEAFSGNFKLKIVTIRNKNAEIHINAFTKNKDELVVYGQSGSTAEAFANSREYKFETIGISSMVSGSVFVPKKLDWQLNLITGVLNVSGEGEMQDWDLASGNKMPWYAYRKDIQTVEIADTLTSIGKNALQGCRNLQTVVIPDSIESIDETAFAYCPNLTIKGKTGSYAESYAKAHSIPFEAAAGSSGEILGSGTCGENLTWTLDNSGVLTVSGTGRMAEWSSKNEVPWYRSRAEISKAVLEEGVTNIGGYAFYECTNLKDIAIPDGVTGIGSYAFAKCSALREITLPWSVGSVSGWTFCECAGLQSLTILNYDCNITGNPQTVCSEIIDDYTARDRAPFRGTIYSYSGSAAETFAQLHGKPFSAIEKPASGTWGSLTWEFDGTDTLNISGTGDMADFSSRPVWNARCADVKKAVIADGITSISAYAFRDFGQLTEIVIPESVRHIGREAFSGTQWLADRIAEDPLVIVNSSLYTGKTCKGKVTIPEGVTELVDEAFYKAWDITGVTFPESLTRIGESAFFNDTELKTVVLPAAVESIGKNAFARCYPDKVTVLNGHAVIGEGAFGTDDDLILAGYDGSTAEAYAKEFSLAFESLGAAPEIPSVKYGDVNDDGSIDLKDVTELRRALADWDVTIQAEAADVNRDGSLDLKDLVILRRYLAGGWGVELPAGTKGESA